jgi:outer membrane protein assembly factor BamB
MLIALLLAALLSWTAPVDSRTMPQWLAESPGRVYAIQDGHLAALSAANGDVLWTNPVAAADAPAYLRGTLAVPTGNGLAFIEARSGRTIVVLHAPGSVSVAPGSSAIVAVHYGDGTSAWAAGYDRHARVLWTRRLERTENMQVYPIAGDAVAVFDLWKNAALVLDAKTGNAVAQATYVDSLIGQDGRYLWFSVAGGGIKGLDLDTNRTIAVHGHVLPKGASVEHGRAVAVIDGRLHVIDLRSGTDRRLRIDGRWIGGPIAGKILVERGDGLYVQPITGSGRARRVVRYSSESRIVAADRSIAYVGLLNGRIIAIDMRTERAVQNIWTPCRFYEGFTASGTTSVVHCDSQSGHSQLVAFARAALF